MPLQNSICPSTELRSSAAAAAAVVVDVFSVGLVSLMAVPVTRLGPFVVDGMVASFSTALLRWLRVYGRESLGINQINETRIQAVEDDCANR